ncbi:hypothetical protein IGI04_026603 [Brassica rapa subsp. trilocularis]|uniref:C3H1-type domain-containing protein n=1 Tax=Brassica rapa subsp. trilocularis TaxID=1813537 RepID=A0ABQ7KZ32_BRACM|nr:hypothetical protein IGI04_026603 [Brassica rapa subsp. trilocularis]
MADALDNQQEDQRSGSNETESRSNEETKGQTLDMRPSGSGTRSVEKTVVRYDRDTRFRDANREATPDRDPIAHAIYWEKKVQELRVRNAEMKQRRANETIQKQRLRNAEMQQRRSRETESIFFQQQKNREYECSGSRMNEAGPIRDQHIRENPRDFGMEQPRSHETEWRFQKQQNRAEAPDLGYKRRRFEQEQYPTRPRIKKGVCHFYLKKGWCGFGSDCVFKHPTPSWRFDGRRYETEVPEKMARTVYGRGRGSTWRFDEERESGYGEAQENNIWWQRREAPENVWEQRDSTAGWLSYDERRRMNLREQEQRDREREVRNEGAHNSESSPQLGTERVESDGI